MTPARHDEVAAEGHAHRSWGVGLLCSLARDPPRSTLDAFRPAVHARHGFQGGNKQMTTKAKTGGNTRRKFLRGATVAGAAVAAPAVVQAQGPITMRWQSTWPSKDIFHEYALDYAKKV